MPNYFWKISKFKKIENRNNSKKLSKLQNRKIIKTANRPNSQNLKKKMQIEKKQTRLLKHVRSLSSFFSLYQGSNKNKFSSLAFSPPSWNCETLFPFGQKRIYHRRRWNEKLSRFVIYFTRSWKVERSDATPQHRKWEKVSEKNKKKRKKNKETRRKRRDERTRVD